MNPSVDYIAIHKLLLNKMKKKLFKKPNILEIEDNLSSFAQKLKDDECPEYAAVFLISKARCECSNGNRSGEAQLLLSAGQSFLDAEIQMSTLHVYSLEEDLECAITCICQATKIFESLGFISMAVNAMLQLADCLALGPLSKHMFKFSQAATFYSQALKLLQINHSTDSPTSYNLSRYQVDLWLDIMQKLAFCQVRMKDFNAALTTFVEIQEMITDGNYFRNKAACDIFITAEVYRVILLLILGPMNFKILKSTYSLERYLLSGLNDDTLFKNEGKDLFSSILQENLFICLQSLVLAVESSDLLAAEQTINELTGFCCLVEVELLMVLWNELKNPSGETF